MDNDKSGQGLVNQFVVRNIQPATAKTPDWPAGPLRSAPLQGSYMLNKQK